jgi:hypothetical protein
MEQAAYERQIVGPSVAKGCADREGFGKARHGRNQGPAQKREANNADSVHSDGEIPISARFENAWADHKVRL